jgi:hypothetical protein
MIFFILVITLRDRKTLFCVFLTFRDLNEVKLTKDFGGANISSREGSGALGCHQLGQEGQTDPGGAPNQGGRATRSISLLDRLILLILSPTDFV